MSNEMDGWDSLAAALLVLYVLAWLFGPFVLWELGYR